MKRGMQALAMLAMIQLLGGCVISLFSDNEAVGVDEERVQELEDRMDTVEEESSTYGY